MLFVNVLLVASVVGGCELPIYARVVRMDVAFLHFSRNPPNSASVTDDMTLIMILTSTCTVQFSGGIAVIGMLDFGPRKKYPPALLHVSGSEI